MVFYVSHLASNDRRGRDQPAQQIHFPLAFNYINSTISMVTFTVLQFFTTV